MTIAEFHGLVDMVITVLSEIAANSPERITSCRSGEDFEVRVVEASLEAISRLV